MSLTLEHILLPLAHFSLQLDVQIRAPITGLCGPSGSGKTTLLEIITGLRRPQQGRVLLGKRVLTDVEQRCHVPVARRRVGYMPQDLALFPHLSASQNLYYGYHVNASTAPQPERVIDILELSPLLTRPVQQLSGGEQQRIALGRALLANPEILLMDEPLSSLDDRLKERILPYFKAIPTEFRIPLIYVTHSSLERHALCDEVIFLEQGQVIPPSESLP